VAIRIIAKARLK